MVLEQNFLFLVSGFLFTCGIFPSIFTVFLNFFYRIFSRLPYPIIVHYRSSFLFEPPSASQRLFFRRSPLKIRFFVLHKSRFSRLTSDLLHSVFQLNGF